MKLLSGEDFDSEEGDIIITPKHTIRDVLMYLVNEKGTEHVAENLLEIVKSDTQIGVDYS
jgi:hypothetical protein